MSKTPTSAAGPRSVGPTPTRRSGVLRIAAAVALSTATIVWAWRSAHDARLPPVPPRPVLTGDAAVVERFQCHRCHRAEGRLVPTSREGGCVDCHRAIRAGDFDGTYDEARVEHWRAHAISLVAAPSLGGLDRRFRRGWVIEFLSAPHDLRPALAASMPRLRVTPADAEAIARHFELVEPRDDEPSMGDVEAGRAVFVGAGCVACHAFTGAGTAAPPPSDPHVAADDARLLAPDLRVTRERMTRASVRAWLTDPAAIDPDARMPTPSLTPAERDDVIAFLFEAPLGPIEPPPRSSRLPLLTRAVTYAEVDEAVFHRTCRHCHADPIPVGGDGGPGNTGGFGFAPRGIDLSTYEAIDARRATLLAPEPDGTPLLVAALWRRHEELRGVLDDRRGMPLALPPVSLETIQLVESWVAQGAPR